MLMESAPAEAMQPQQYRLFSGPSPYRAVTPWRPLTAFAVTVLILLLTLVSVTAAVWLMTAGHPAETNKLTLALVGTPIQQVLMIALTWGAACLYGGKPLQMMALGPPAQGWRAYVICFLLLVGGVGLMGAAIHAFDPNANKGDVEAFQEMFASPGWPIALFIVGIGAPLSEELLFRGYLFPALAKTRVGANGAALLTSSGWAAVHFYSPLGMAQVFVIGMIFSWILIRTGSLRVTVLCHALYNSALAVLMMAGADGWV